MKKKSEWFLLIGLIVLVIVPTLAGIVRIFNLGSAEAFQPENIRFTKSPISITLHVVSSILFSILGIFQIIPSFRIPNLKWHRRIGRVLLPIGFISSLTGLYMTQFYPKVETDGPTLYFIRLLVGFVMTLFLILAVYTVLNKKFRDHGNWMIRAYALGLGASTQVITHLPWLITTGQLPTGLTRDMAMGAGWLINLAIVEWRIRKT
ncbi:MAG TPA: DUF2306 domain-containing protein [Leptospiraceae bacterium]|nr:DUF2306 domain-containing protein [Leptospiraceae bacterium]HMW06261.1 DUF2306 domain-containing protein [Leptospiraceae bacterium]HMX33178.1 DUF2306 domain-containing protein [Leptospiraceae bacterium]HMY31723.1 DUF2306 domain-containing protein [Leptospiraceae bacterium]HMZ64516.1 DUF2306 domain-containing protein [Leptospiraceae bacterium]